MKPGHPAPARRLLDAATQMGVTLSPATAATLVALLERLSRERQNLTAVTGIEDGVDRHLADSLAVLAVLPDPVGVCDIGSGGGFPGLVLALALPEVPVTLVESERRKADWLRRASADLPNVRVVDDRTEHLARVERERFPLVTARAVAPPVPALEMAAPLVAPGGRVALWAGPRYDEAAAVPAGAVLGLEPEGAHVVTPFPGAHRRIAVWRKTGPTPARFPRRPGRATARPLA